KIMHAVMDIIDKLDIRRPQVLVEAIIAEVDVDKNAELGVNLAAFSKGSNVPAGAFVSPVGGTSIVDLAAAIQNPANASSALLQGTTIGIGRIAGTGVNFAATLRALRGDTNTNVLSTPSAVTMDNQEAEPKVAQEVRSEEHTSELQSRGHIVCRLLLEKKKRERTEAFPYFPLPRIALSFPISCRRTLSGIEGF